MENKEPNKIVNETQILEEIELNEQEKKVFKQRKFGFNALDSSLAIILGGVIAPVLMAVIALFVITFVSVVAGLSVEDVLKIPFVYCLYGSSTILGYGIYVLIICKRKAKSSINAETFENGINAKNVVPSSKCVLKWTIISVAIGALSLLLLNLFVNLSTIGLQGLGYSKSNELPITMNSFGNYLLGIIFLSVFPAFCEEFLFRGLILGGLLNSAKTHKQSICAVLISAVIFALCHQSAQQFVYPLIMGTIFGFIFLYSGNIWYSVIAHFSSNALVFTYNYILNVTQISPEQLSINWLYCLIAVAGFILFAVIMFFIFKHWKKRENSVFNFEKIDIRIKLIEEKLIEKEKDLKYIKLDGILGFKRSRKEQNRLSLWVGLVAISLLLILLISDLITYI